MDTQQHHWARTLLYSLAWLICSLLVIVDILAIREASLDVMTAIRVRQIANAPEREANIVQIETGFTMQAVDQGLLFFGGVVAVVAAIGLEYYFRMGQQKGKLLQRIGLVVGIQVLIFIICVVIQTLV